MVLWLYLLALGHQIGFSPRWTKSLSFIRLYLLGVASSKNLPYCKEWVFRSYRMAWYRYIPLPIFPDVWWDMPTDTRSDGYLDRQLSSWIYQSAGDVEAKQLRKDHSSWTGYQEAIWFQGLRCKRRHQETVMPAPAVWSGKYAASRLDTTNMQSSLWGQSPSIC